MAQGKLGAVAVAAAAWTLAYTVPASTVATANIRIVNRGNTATTLRVAVTTSGLATPPDSDMIEFDAILPPSGGVLEDTSIVCSAGEKVMVYSESTAVSVRVHGFERAV